MASHEDYPDKVFVPLDAELLDQLEAPFGIMEFMTGDTIYECPYLGTRYMGEDGQPVEMYLHWFNTTVRLFKGKSWASHADVYMEDRKVGVVLDEDTIDAMLELNFRVDDCPLLACDPASVKWLAERAMSGFDDEVDGL